MNPCVSLRLVVVAVYLVLFSPRLRAQNEDLWQLAKNTAAIHRFSTLFTAHDVKNHLSSEEGRTQAKEWCRNTGVTHVFIESFRDGYQAERTALIRARDEFKQAGFEVSGCVTTTQVGKKSSGWNLIACYTDLQTQERIRQIFHYTAELFDEIMIDDFWFTDCECADCNAARLAKSVKIKPKQFTVPSDSWSAYHCELMVRLSQKNVLEAAQEVNPKVEVIIKYPQWYDRFHFRGYEVLRETADFDRIWVGTETRDYGDARWGGTVQYEAYFIMRWLGEIGGAKCGGGWYDWLGTTEKTYVEQARQTVLAGAKESLLFCYSGLQGTTGPRNIAALRLEIPDLQGVAAEVQKRVPIGVAAYKPANSNAEKEARVFDFVGMLGVPLIPTHYFPTNAPSAFFSVHALSDPTFVKCFQAYVATRRPVLVTDGLAKRLENPDLTCAPNVQVLSVNDDPKTLLQLDEEELNRLRAPSLSALKLRFQGPNRVSLYAFADGSWVIENFNDDAVNVDIQGQKFQIRPRDWQRNWK